MTFAVQVKGDAIRFAVHVQPRATASAIVGLHGDALKVRLAAPPVDGAANEELVRFVAAELGIPRRDVRLVTGATARAKVLEVTGVPEVRVRQLAVASPKR